MTAIHLKGLTKSFGPFTALQPMDLTIRDGEFMALLGPSLRQIHHDEHDRGDGAALGRAHPVR